MKRSPIKRGSRLKRKRRTQADIKWRLKVLGQDGYRCRWVDKQGQRCEVRGTPENNSHLDAHHINERSQRPDLRHEITNGATLCGGPGNHHDRAHHTVEGRAAAKAQGLLGGTTYEKARKESR